MKNNLRHLPKPAKAPDVVRKARQARKQDEVTRRRRLNAGLCPTHGLDLSQVGVNATQTAPIVGCPRQDCGFEIEVVEGTALAKALHGEK